MQQNYFDVMINTVWSSFTTDLCIRLLWMA